MRKDIHPEYGYVIFRDTSADFAILTRSTMKSLEFQYHLSITFSNQTMILKNNLKHTSLEKSLLKN